MWVHVCVYAHTHTHTHTAHMGNSDVSPGFGMRHLEGLKNPDGLNLGIYVFVYVYTAVAWLLVCLFVCLDKTRTSILRSLCLEGSNNPWEWLHTESGVVVQKLIRHGPRA